MWSLLVSLAAATPAGDTSCGAGVVQGVRPADGSVVPPDVIPQVAFDGCFVLVQLETELGALVEAEQLFFGDRLVLVPVEPLEPGGYVLADYTYDREPLGRFTVAADAEPPPWTAPVELSVGAERSCEGALSALVDVVATFEPDPEGWATLALEVSTESGVQQTVEALWYGQTYIERRIGVFGGREVCVRPSLLDATGAAAWVGDVACAEPFEGCPADPRDPSPVEEGCGCTSAGPSGGLAVAAALVASRRRYSSRTRSWATRIASSARRLARSSSRASTGG